MRKREIERQKKLAQKRMREAVKFLQDYMNAYDQQHGYMDYSDTILIDDVLYGLGAALYQKRGSQGWSEIQNMLVKHLLANIKKMSQKAA